MEHSKGPNLSSVASAGLEGLPGVIIAVTFVLMGIGYLLPSEYRSGWTGTVLLCVFVAVEVVVAAIFVIAQRRDRRLAQRIEAEFHQLSHPAESSDESRQVDVSRDTSNKP